MQFKKDRMSPNERIEALLNRQPVDRVPFFSLSQGFNTLNVGYSIAEYYRNPKKSFEAAMWTHEQYNWDMLPLIGYAALCSWEFGGEIKWPDGVYSQAPSVVRYPVETEDDVRNLKIPDVSSAGIIPIFLEWARYAENAGIRYCITIEEPFVGAGNFAGLDKLCRWMLKKPELAHKILKMSTDFKIELAYYFAKEVGTKRLIPWNGDASSDNRIISPKMYEEFAYPYTKRLHEKLLDMGYKHLCPHICGEQNRNYPFWEKVPMGDPGIISVSHEVDLEKAMTHFPNDIIMGNIEPAVIQSGTPEEVYARAKKCIEKGRKAKSGFILSPGCELPPSSPPHNVWTIMRAIDDFGWYE